MVEKLLMQMLLAALLLGVLGMAMAYLIFGRIAGHYIDPRTIFSTGGSMLENAGPALLGIEDLRYKIFAGGLAGILAGSFIPVMYFKMSRGS